MKKNIFALIALVTIVFAAVFCFTSCVGEEKGIVNLYVPDGAPALATAKLLQYKILENMRLNIVITTGANVQSKIMSGEASLAVCPTNMAASLYNKGVKYKLVSANLFGLLYLVGNVEINDVNKLKGKVVYSIGKNNTPEFVMKKILSSKNIAFRDGDSPKENEVTIRYFENGAQIIPLLKSGKCDFAVLGEPAATKSGAKTLFDLQKLWNESTQLDGSYPQAGVFASEKLLEENGHFIDSLLKILDSNSAYILENSSSVAKNLSEHGSADFKDMTLTADIIQRCNVRCVKASECRLQLETYFNAIQTVNPSFKLPDDGFYGR